MITEFIPTAPTKAAYDDRGAFAIPWDAAVDRWLILEDAEGTLYTAQSGGFACEHPMVCGRLFSSPELDESLSQVESYVYDRFSGYCVPRNHFFHEESNGRCLDAEAADAIDGILSKSGFPEIVIDRSRMEESMEAWLFALWDGKRCVLVTNNSD